MNMIRNMLLGFFIAVGVAGQAGAMQVLGSLAWTALNSLPLTQSGTAHNTSFSTTDCDRFLAEQQYYELSRVLYRCLDDTATEHTSLVSNAVLWVGQALTERGSLDPLLLYMNSRRAFTNKNTAGLAYINAFADFVLCVVLSSAHEEFLRAQGRSRTVVPNFSKHVKDKIVSQYGNSSFMIRDKITFNEVKEPVIERLKKFAILSADNPVYPLPHWLLHVMCGRSDYFGIVRSWGIVWGNLDIDELSIRQNSHEVAHMTERIRAIVINKIAILQAITSWSDFLEKDMLDFANESSIEESIHTLTEEIKNLLQQQEAEQGNKKES